MLLGIKTWRTVLLRHFVLAAASAGLLALSWQVHSAWSPDMRLWKAFGTVTFTLLWFAVVIGPLARLWRPLIRLVSWRREAGVWFVLVAAVHGYLVWDGWARWDFWRLLGYEYVPELDQYLRFEPGFGLANAMGIVALALGLVLAATSFDKAVSSLGISSWKWLHSMVYVIFAVVALHVLYFAFIHYTPSPFRVMTGQATEYPENPLTAPYVGMIGVVMVGQALAFTTTIARRRRALA